MTYHLGSRNVKPGALSRHSTSMRLLLTQNPSCRPPVLSLPSPGRLSKLVRRAQNQQADPGNCPSNHLFVPDSVHPQVLQWAHTSWLTCHPGLNHTLAFLRQQFWWCTMKADTRSFISACCVCTQNKSSTKPSSGLLRPFPAPSHPWSHIALDFVTGPSPSNSKTVILTIIDLFSKSAHFLALPKLPSARETASLLVEHVFRLHGLPADFILGIGPQFISQVWKT